MNIIEECVKREAERERVQWGEADDVQMGYYRSNVSAIVADVLDILTADGRVFLPPPAVAAGIAPPPGEPRWHQHAAPTPAPDELRDKATTTSKEQG